MVPIPYDLLNDFTLRNLSILLIGVHVWALVGSLLIRVVDAAEVVLALLPFS